MAAAPGLESQLALALELADIADAITMPLFRSLDLAVSHKADASEVTAADRASEAIILETLRTLEPHLPIVAEEDCADNGLPEFAGDDFWLVDALDGTREFVKRGTDFTVNIGLIQAGIPVFGIVHAPARSETFVGVISGAQRRAEHHGNGRVSQIAVRPRPARVNVAGSKSHKVGDTMDAFVARHDVAEMIEIGSSLKFCLVAMGQVDLYPRFGPTSEWDTAAGHAVVRAAGGRVHTFDGVELRYHKPKFLNGTFLVDNGAT